MLSTGGMDPVGSSVSDTGVHIVRTARSLFSLIAVSGLLVGVIAGGALADEDYPPEVRDVTDEDVEEEEAVPEADVEEAEEEVVVQAEVLSVTGGDIVPLLVGGVLLALIGGLLVVAARRRRVNQAS